MFGAKKFISKLGCENTIRSAVTATLTSWQLTEEDSFVFIDSTVGVGTVYLPPVTQCQGCTIVITNKGANNLTVSPFASVGALLDSAIYNGSAAVTSQVLANANAFTKLSSDGEKWIADQFDLSV